MKYNVNADTIENTDKCKHDYSCLSGEKECICDVKKSIDDKIILVNPSSFNTCDYLISFGNSYICNCPVRTEIYKMFRA